jgi:hypothetical protein
LLLRVREWVLETLGPLHFTRTAKETVAQLLGAQQIFQDLLPQQKIPFRLTRKPFFQAGLRLFELGMGVRGGEPIRFSLPLEEKTFYRRKRKRRSRRNSRGRTFRNPGRKEVPPGHSTP